MLYFDPRIMMSILLFSNNLLSLNAIFLILPVSHKSRQEKSATQAQKCSTPSKTDQENMVTLQMLTGKIATVTNLVSKNMLLGPKMIRKKMLPIVLNWSSVFSLTTITRNKQN